MPTKRKGLTVCERRMTAVPEIHQHEDRPEGDRTNQSVYAAI